MLEYAFVIVNVFVVSVQGYGYPPAYAPTHQKGGGGLLDNAGKLLAGGLAGVGLAKVAVSFVNV